MRIAWGLAPDRAETILKLERLVAQTADHLAAITALREAARRKPPLSDAHITLLHRLEKNGRIAVAVAAGQTAVIDDIHDELRTLVTGRIGQPPAG